MSSIIQNHPEQVEQLKHEEAFMMNTYKDSIKVAKQMFPKVVRNTFFDVKLSPRLIDNDFILKALKAFHKQMDFMKDFQKYFFVLAPYSGAENKSKLKYIM